MSSTKIFIIRVVSFKAKNPDRLRVKFYGGVNGRFFSMKLVKYGFFALAASESFGTASAENGEKKKMSVEEMRKHAEEFGEEAVQKMEAEYRLV